jgi:hypothetical protein
MWYNRHMSTSTLQSQSNISTEEKAAMFDWLMTPTSSGRADRPDRLGRTINKNSLSALLVFQAWGSQEEILQAIKKEMSK